jgi:hypothetical protein
MKKQIYMVQIQKHTQQPTKTTTINNQPPDIDHSKQITLINELFLSSENATDELHELCKKRISKKLAGYKQQDVGNNIFDPAWFISADELLTLMVESRLRCYYCRTNCSIIYAEPMFKYQWTLDRVSNDQGHNRQNVVVACLKCNLHRGVKPSCKYKLGKQMKFIKSHLSTYVSDVSDDVSDSSMSSVSGSIMPLTSPPQPQDPIN